MNGNNWCSIKCSGAREGSWSCAHQWTSWAFLSSRSCHSSFSEQRFPVCSSWRLSRLHSALAPQAFLIHQSCLHGKAGFHVFPMLPLLNYMCLFFFNDWRRLIILMWSLFFVYRSSFSMSSFETFFYILLFLSCGCTWFGTNRRLVRICCWNFMKRFDCWIS